MAEILTDNLHLYPPPPHPPPDPLTLYVNKLPFGRKGWQGGESARLPPMWPGFKSRRRRLMWVEFVVGFSPLL